jgi:hypothetical protein
VFDFGEEEVMEETFVSIELKGTEPIAAEGAVT